METFTHELFDHKIKLLPEHIIDQIKAGEIIERPSFVIKELLENSIDAKATEISLTIIDNGLKLIQIRDNGIGIHFKDLPYAFLRHATSKIETFEDVFKLSSYGFRGEALASIASIARVSCESIPQAAPHDGGKLTIVSGKIEKHSALKGEKGEQGTTLSVQDLFFNTPVRLKFLKSKTAEKNQLKKIVESFLINSPHIAFTLKWDQEDKIYYEAVTTTQERLCQILNRGTKKQSADLNETTLSYENSKITAYLSHGKKSEYLFINGRLILDKTLLQFIHFQLTKLLGDAATVAYFIFLELPRSEIDVNVHPNKTVVKFADQNLIYSLITAALKKFQVKAEPNTNLPLPELNQPVIARTTINSDTFNIDEFYFVKPNYLINFKLFLTHLFVETIFSRPIKNEEELRPLFVAEPIYMPLKKVDSKLTFFKQHGFEMERINPEFLILKTLPVSLNSSAPILKLLNSYFIFLNENLADKNLAKLTESFFANYDFNSSQLFTEFYPTIPLTSGPFVKELATKNLQQFFTN